MDVLKPVLFLQCYKCLLLYSCKYFVRCQETVVIFNQKYCMINVLFNYSAALEGSESPLIINLLLRIASKNSRLFVTHTHRYIQFIRAANRALISVHTKISLHYKFGQSHFCGSEKMMFECYMLIFICLVGDTPFCKYKLCNVLCYVLVTKARYICVLLPPLP